MESNRFNLAPGTVLDQEFSGGAVFEGTRAIRLHNGAREYQSVIIPCLQGQTYALGLRFLTDSLGSDKPHTKDLLPEIRA